MWLGDGSGGDSGDGSGDGGGDGGNGMVIIVVWWWHKQYVYDSDIIYSDSNSSSGGGGGGGDGGGSGGGSGGHMVQVVQAVVTVPIGNGDGAGFDLINMTFGSPHLRDKYHYGASTCINCTQESSATLTPPTLAFPRPSFPPTLPPYPKRLLPSLPPSLFHAVFASIRRTIYLTREIIVL